MKAGMKQREQGIGNEALPVAGALSVADELSFPVPHSLFPLLEQDP